jgi:membrane peptidoglycan carboxypeptidase
MATIRPRGPEGSRVHAGALASTSYDALVSVTQAALRAGGKLSALLAFFAVAAIAGTLIACVITPAVAIAGGATKQQINAFQNLPANLDITPLDQKTRIYAKSKGKDVLLASFFSQNRDVLTWDQVPAVVKNATLAAEDVRFYQHGPIDPNGIARALVSNLLHKNIQGASTISQQYVKNVCVQQAEALTDPKAAAAGYLDCTDKSYNRKIREMRLAIGLEKKYTKDQILLGYLNIAGFGGRTYGIEAASEYYYGKKARDLTIGQAATLISIVNNPEAFRLDKKANLPGAAGRRNYVLGVERRHGMISAADYQRYSTEKIVTKLTPPSTGCDSAGTAGFFCDYVVQTILTSKQFGKNRSIRLANLDTKGWQVYTTLDLDLQNKAQKVMNTYVPMKSKQIDIGGAAVSLQVGTGRVLTMVQNKVYDASGAKYRKDFKYSAVNFNVPEALGAGGGAQPGSTFKSVNVVGWLESGHTVNQIVNSNARSIPMSNFTACGSPMSGPPPQYTFKNDANEKGNVDVQTATANSINGAFLSMAEEQDLCKMRDIAESMGATNARGGRLVVSPSMAIGTASSIAPISMAQVFGTIANKGVTCQSIGIDKVLDAGGRSLPVPSAACKRTVPENVAIAAGYDLHNPLTRGTMAGDNFINAGRFMLGKTGTTDFAKDTWAIGSTTKVTTAVWVGNRVGNTNLRTIYGGPACNQGNRYAEKRHCVFQGIAKLMNSTYGGAYSWPTPESQFLSGGKAIVHKDAGAQHAAAKPQPKPTQPKPTQPKPTQPTGTPATGTGTGSGKGNGNGGAPVKG